MIHAPKGGEVAQPSRSAPALTKTSRRRHLIARYWTIACLDRACVNCGCGRSLESELAKETADDFELIT